MEELAVDTVAPDVTRPVLSAVSLAVAPGRLVGLVGETGSGKSVTARFLLDIAPPALRRVGGRIRFDGVELPGRRGATVAALRGSTFAFVPQNPRGALHPTLSVERQFGKLVRGRRGLTRRQLREEALAALASCGIAQPERVLDGHAHELSGGMAQRVAIAIAMALQPSLLVADEPTTGLDVTVQRQILDLLAQRVRREHASMLLITHDLGVVARYCDEVVVLYAGATVEQAAADALVAEPAHPYTRLLVQAARRPMDDPPPLPALTPDEHASKVSAASRGCPFLQRCPLRFERCVSERPALRHLAGGRSVACHRAEEVIPGARDGD